MVKFTYMILFQIVCTLLLLTWRTYSFHFQSLRRIKLASKNLYMQPTDHDSNTKPDREAMTSVLLDKMLNKAANLAIESMQNSSEIQETTTSGYVKPLFHNLPLTFASHYSKKLLFNQTKNALEYLALPARNYSVLNSTVVTKSVEDDSTFLIRLPLRDFASALDSISPQVNYRALGNYVLATSIKVDPKPEVGKVLMRSGPFYFLPAEEVDNKTNQSEVSIQTIIAKDILPTWLIWGGQNDNQVPTISTTEDLSKELVEENFSSSNTSTNSVGIKSSVQPTLSIELKWDPQAEEHHSKQGFSKWNRAVQNWWKNTANSLKGNQTSPQVNDEDILPVKLKVAIKMEMNIPLPYRIGKALSVLPVKVLIQQAGSLVISTFLHNLIPPFTKLLLRDYENRKLKIKKVNEDIQRELIE